MYGPSATGFAPCCRIAFFGALGPVGIGGSCETGGLGVGGVVGGVVPPLCVGDEENLEDMLDSHEFRLVLGDGEPDLGMLPFNVWVLSVEALLEKPGRCGGMAFGVDAGFGDGSGGC